MTDLRQFKETIKQIRHGKPQPKFCPACYSHNIYHLPTMGILPTTYVCRDCGYRGALVLEIEPEEEQTEKSQDDPDLRKSDGPKTG